MSTSAAPAPNERERLARLRALKLLDTPPEPLFDSLARLAAHICGTPMALVTLVDEHRQWFKANVGLQSVTQTPREVAFCSHTILSEGLMEVPDAQDDERFAGNALVVGDPHIRFYAGVPLSLGDGVRVGSLCVIDRVPRQLTVAQRAALAETAHALSLALLLRDAGTVSIAEQALLHSEQKFRALSDSSPFGVYHTDLEGQCTYTNQRWQAIYGINLTQSLGDGWSQGLHEDDRAAVFSHWQACAAAGQEFAMEFRVRHPDGAVRHVRSRARALLDETGRTVGYVGAVEDITEREETEQRLRSEQAARAQVERHADELNALLTERTEMLDVLAHEVRQPLNNASAALQTASAALAGHHDSAAAQPLRRAQEVLAGVIEGVNNTLAVSTALVGSSELVQVDADLDMLVSIAIADMAPAERPRLQVLRETAVRTVWVDVGLLRLALRNLIANALHHSPPHCAVQIIVRDAQAPGVLNIDVRDQGHGIAPELMPRLFLRGARAGGVAGAGQRTSHGLGLFIARRAMELQRGTVTLLSTSTQGTTMRLQITEA